MNKISLIIKREYLSRIKKKSFLLMTILGPILLAALIIVPVWLSEVNKDIKTIAVVDDYQTKFNDSPFYKRFKDSPNLKFEYVTDDILNAKSNFKNTGFYALLYIPKSFLNNPKNVAMYSDKQIALNVKMYVENELEKTVENLKMSSNLYEELKKLNIDTTNIHNENYEQKCIEIADKLKSSVKSPVVVITNKMNDDGSEERNSSIVITFLAYFSGFLIYMFVFLFGAQLMRGVIEEKTNRIVEIIISSVKPFQLMIGKIIGIAMVGLTQFLLWVVLTFTIVTTAQAIAPHKLNFNRTDQVLAQADLATKTAINSEQAIQINEMMLSISSINFGVIITMFIFYFLAGYLFYAALFAAVGAAVDSDTDTQQFMLPLSLPLAFGVIMLQFVIMNPQSSLSYWLSIIPFTSPIIMMARLPFGVPVYTGSCDLIVSALLLILGIIFNTWIAAKIYRTGILMYGKKVGYREIWKWIRYKS